MFSEVSRWPRVWVQESRCAPWISRASAGRFCRIASTRVPWCLTELTGLSRSRSANRRTRCDWANISLAARAERWALLPDRVDQGAMVLDRADRLVAQPQREQAHPVRLGEHQLGRARQALVAA